MLLVIRQLRLQLRLHSDAEVVRTAIDLLRAARQKGAPEHLIRSRYSGQDYLIRLESEK